MSIEAGMEISTLLTTTPLYERIPVQGPGGAEIRDIVMYSGTFDAFCPSCGSMATFSGLVTNDWQRASDAHMASMSISNNFRRGSNPFAISAFSKTVRCTRNPGHLIHSYFELTSDHSHIVKVGQYPSVADILKGDAGDLAAELGRERAREFNMAIAASAHGVGIGAHVYLRRIFESLVEDAHRVAKEREGWDEEAYGKARMADKVAMLRAELPDFLVQHPELYSALSIHLHALSEEVARQNFEKLKQAILIIAEQKREAKKKADRERAARAALGEVVREIAPARSARE